MTDAERAELEPPTVTSVVMQAMRGAGLPVTSLGVARMADALLGLGCRIADVERAAPAAEQERPDPPTVTVHRLIATKWEVWVTLPGGARLFSKVYGDEATADVEAARIRGALSESAELAELHAIRDRARGVLDAGIEWDPAWRRAARHILGEAT